MPRRRDQLNPYDPTNPDNPFYDYYNPEELTYEQTKQRYYGKKRYYGKNVPSLPEMPSYEITEDKKRQVNALQEDIMRRSEEPQKTALDESSDYYKSKRVEKRMKEWKKPKGLSTREHRHAAHIASLKKNRKGAMSANYTRRTDVGLPTAMSESDKSDSENSKFSVTGVGGGRRRSRRRSNKKRTVRRRRH